MNFTEVAKESLKETGYYTANNFEVIKVEKGYCELEGTITETSLNPYGIAHGGYLFGLADTAAGIACRTNSAKAVTLNASVEYLRACKCKKVKAVATCIKDGKTTSLYSVNVLDENGEILIHSNMTYFYLEK